MPIMEPHTDQLPNQAYVHTPFFPQNEFHCGPAALAAALGAAGIAIHPDELAPKVYLPGREGSLQIELIAAARETGRVVYILEPAVEDALREVAAGYPVLVLQNLGLSWYPRWHYALLIGYDINAGTVTLHSGTTQDYVVALSTFDRTWARAGRWGVVITLPGEIPETAQEIPYVHAVAQLERRNPAAATQAYLTALRHWPDSLASQIGLGNARYANNDLAGSREAFSDARHSHPQSAVAHNNYAYVSMRLGFIDDARLAAERAIELSGTTLPEAKQTLDSILAQ